MNDLETRVVDKKNVVKPMLPAKFFPMDYEKISDAKFVQVIDHFVSRYAHRYASHPDAERLDMREDIYNGLRSTVKKFLTKEKHFAAIIYWSCRLKVQYSEIIDFFNMDFSSRAMGTYLKKFDRKTFESFNAQRTLDFKF